jgi:hypothetical protein
MATYDPTGHPSLSDAANRLDPEQLIDEADLAETVLRRGPTMLADTAFEEDTAEWKRAVLAVVHQINWRVERGVEGEVYQSRSRGGRSATYRDDSISPTAQALVDALIPLTVDEVAWPVAGGLR